MNNCVSIFQSKPINLPFGKCKQRTNLEKHKVLLVEDNAMIRYMEGELLRIADCSVSLAADGKEALKKLKNKPSLIFLDIGLPDINGIELCKKIRAKGITTPIVMLTAHGDDLRTNALAAGANEYVIKPLRKEKIKTILQEWQDKTSS